MIGALAALGGVLTVLFLSRKGSAAPAPPSMPGLTPQQDLVVNYRRVTRSEVPADIIARAPTFLAYPMGSITFETSSDGRQWAFVVEEHSNAPKGVSVFAHR